jgi:hypothetical protein
MLEGSVCLIGKGNLRKEPGLDDDDDDDDDDK